MIVIVDYGLGNLASVRNAFRVVGADIVVSSDTNDIEAADGVVLPGVGAAQAGMDRLRTRGLVTAVQEAAGSGRPFFGICLGMQLLFEYSEEGAAGCLSILPGTVRMLRGEVKIPHIGWNQVATRPSPLWANMAQSPFMYFVHSYVCVPADESLIAGETEYGEKFCSVVSQGSVWGTQFHPERSGTGGLQLIRNFVAACRRNDNDMVGRASA